MSPLITRERQKGEISYIISFIMSEQGAKEAGLDLVIQAGKDATEQGNSFAE